ncbi:hypothetical protein PHYPO_G00154390 [Pangasianodon hypophthalmus]|uniref:Uncharacterized protein n=1 Tax=Pangasianodon hypophthalmus TaxID=310915 RepID=A0A5N5JWG6_PANHP|nr:hypothetical protein PHYPO_G00154390 [Pangasianodon hypophthalmus]
MPPLSSTPPRSFLSILHSGGDFISRLRWSFFSVEKLRRSSCVYGNETTRVSASSLVFSVVPGNNVIHRDLFRPIAGWRLVHASINGASRDARSLDTRVANGSARADGAVCAVNKRFGRREILGHHFEAAVKENKGKASGNLTPWPCATTSS